MEEGIYEREKDPGKAQFQHELNKLFESRGIIADLRSHLRHLMITALKSTQAGLKPTDRSSPKAQALNLMIAEYLFKHRCHYTLSVFTSEVPTLASFNPEFALREEKSLEATKKDLRGNCFQEKEVEEIFNALGMSSHEKELVFMKTSYLEKGNQTSLIEHFLQAVIEISTKLQIRQNLERHVEVESERLLSEQWSKKVVDILLSEKMPPSQVTALEEIIFRITENEIKRIVEQEHRLQMQILSEREKRIQEYLKKHEDDILARLIKAEKDLQSRRNVIDEELTEREKHFTKMAVEWKNKREELLRLLKNFHNIENDNQNLVKKLKALEEENKNLKAQEKGQSRTIDDLREEMNLLINKLKEVTDSNVILSERVQALISRENKEVGEDDDVANHTNQKPAKTGSDEIPLLWSRSLTSDGDINFINLHCKESSPKVKSKEFTIKNQTLPHPDQWNITEMSKANLGSGEAEPRRLTLNFHSQDADVSLSCSTSEEEIISGVRKKLQDLEEETNRINQNYLDYKLKSIPFDSDSESSKNSLDKSPATLNQVITTETKFSQTNTEDLFIKLQKLKKKKEKDEERNGFDSAITNKSEVPTRSAVMLTPTKRQLENRDFFLKSRQLLQAFESQKKEKLQSSSSFVDSSSSGSTEDLSGVSEIKNISPVKSVPLTPSKTLTKCSDETLELKNKSSEKGRETGSSNHILRDGINCLALLAEARIKSPQVSARKSLRQRILVSGSEMEEK